MFCLRGSVSRPSSSSFGELTRPRLPCQDFKFGSQVKFQLAATELHRANPVHPPASGTSPDSPDSVLKKKHQI
ncbi:hypothetical protein CRENBAI_009675 [Crenichthys baileyi]|uniref:Uncharacterized protein n=1 Tax=Crenichthys baileyi TaxID=28760 RepID=A0AAV9R8D3_9TELE